MTTKNRYKLSGIVGVAVLSMTLNGCSAHKPMSNVYQSLRSLLSNPSIESMANKPNTVKKVSTASEITYIDKVMLRGDASHPAIYGILTMTKEKNKNETGCCFTVNLYDNKSVADLSVQQSKQLNTEIKKIDKACEGSNSQ